MERERDRVDDIADALAAYDGGPPIDEQTRQYVREWVLAAAAEPIPEHKARVLAHIWNGGIS